jgi:hypothetical protein
MFVAKLDSLGSTLAFSTYLGGAGWDAGAGIAVEPSGSAYVTGFTASGDFPMAMPLQPFGGGTFDAFVVKLSTAPSALIYSTYLGGSGLDYGHNGPPGSFVIEAAIANFPISPAYIQPVKFQAVREAR